MDAPRPDSAARRLAALFPDERPTPTRRPWYRRSGIIVSAGVVVLLVVALVTTQAFGGSGDSYRTARASIEDVDAVQTGVATIEPVAQAAVAFPVSGTVASVSVHVGDHVEAGGTLASLDTAALARTLHAKQAALAQAQLALDKGLSGQPISLGGGSAGGSGSGTSGGVGGSGSGASAANAAARVGSVSTVVLTAASGDPALVAARQAVATAQQHVDAALADAATALSAEGTACAAFASPSPTTTTTPGGSSGTPDVTACQAAITAVTNAQSAVSTAQQALATASSTLDSLLASTTPSAPSGPSGPSTGTPSSGATPSGNAAGGDGGGAGGAAGGTGSASRGTPSSGSGGFGASSAGPSAADLVAAQENVDAATMAVFAAQQSMDQATIASPLAGSVVAVNMKVGDSVSAASSTEDVVVAGTGGYEVSTTVGVDQIPSVAVGQAATVVPDGGHHALSGKVVAISVAPASTSTTSYRVVVGLTNPDASLQDGATGTVQVVTGDAHAALAVPTSAVVTVRNRHFVNVEHDGGETLTPVQVGVVGATWTEIRSGITRGTAVVLADTSAPLPGSATSSANGAQTTTPSGFGRLFGGGAGGAGGGFGRAGRGG